MEKSLVEILGADRSEEVKDAVKDIIIKQIKEDLSQEYLVSSRDVREFAEMILDEVKKELKTEIKKILKDELVARALKDFNL